MDVEEALLRAFIVPERRAHYIARLATPKTRKKLLGRFHHLHDLDARFAVRIEPRLQRSQWIYDALIERGAPTRCYVMSDWSEFDQQELDLQETLAKVVGTYSGTFISCIPGRLGYFEGEEPNERYILERSSDDALIP